MGYMRGEDRKQISLLADSLNALIAEDNLVRETEALVMALDMGS